MDPSSISSPSASAANAVPFAVEPNNHLPSPSLNHPPYAEMIYTAIEALKDKNGSSKRAISKYIEQVYSHQLPPPESHSNLLTHHLKRLKSDGLLQTIKNSYIIPRSTPPHAAPEPPSTASPSQSSKPRGRPRKSQTPTPAQAQPENNFIPQPLPIVVANNNNNNAEPVWAALGLSDEPLDVQPAGTPQAAATPGEGSKRRPGRPPGSKNVAKNVPSSSPTQNSTPVQGQVPPTPTQASRGRGRPPGSKSKSKKKPGRPPKVNPDTPANPAAASDGTKRRPGRPPKNQHQNPTPIPFANTVPEVAQPEVVVPEVVVPAAIPVAVEGAAVLTPRSRGRPRKNPAVAAVPVAVVASGGRGRGRGRGRGGRGSRGGRVGNAFGGITLRAPGKRPVGRPKKGTTPATASASQHAANEVDLRRKLEHFQGKIKESLGVIKPHFDHESPVTALAAIQELEILGAMDLNEPLKDEPHPSQQNVAAQDQPQQAVAQPQVFAQYPPFQQDYHYQQHQSQYHP